MKKIIILCFLLLISTGIFANNETGTMSLRTMSISHK